MDAPGQAALQAYRMELSAELRRRGWWPNGAVYIHEDHGMIDEKFLLSVPLISDRGVDISSAADELENAAKQRHAEMLEDLDIKYDPLEEFRIELENRGMTPLDLFAVVLGDESMSRKISVAIEILGSLDRDKLGGSFDNTCGAILSALVYMLADLPQKI